MPKIICGCICFWGYITILMASLINYLEGKSSWKIPTVLLIIGLTIAIYYICKWLQQKSIDEERDENTYANPDAGTRW